MIKDSLEATKWLTESLTGLLTSAKGRRTRKHEALLKHLQDATVLIDSAATAFAEGKQPWAVEGELREMTMGLKRLIMDLAPGTSQEKFRFTMGCLEAMENALGLIYDTDGVLDCTERADNFDKLHKEWTSHSEVVVKRLRRVAGQLRGLVKTYQLQTL